MTDLASATLDLIRVVVLSAVAATALAVTLPQLVASLHSLQQDDYSNRRFTRWLAAAPTRWLQPWIAAVYLAGAILQVALSTFQPQVWVPSLASCLAVLAAIRSLRRPPQKKPLVYTGRARRLLILSAAIAAFVFAVGFVAVSRLASAAGLAAAAAPGFAVLVMALVSVNAAPLWAMAANLCLFPVQASINLMYRVRARRKLDRFKPMVVGITGSYGKTSTKYFTEALMESRFRVLKTRASFNTILGVCRAINEELGAEHEVLIVEMGAYRRGEIRDMARLTRPHIGVLTAIGPQHLERFGSI